MKLKPTTIVLVLAAAILGGVVYFTQTQTPSSQTGSSETTGTPIFNIEESQVQSFTLKTQLRSLSFEKDSQGVWQMKSPESTTANDASIAFLLNLIATATSDRTLTAPATNREQFGFHQPLAVIEFTLDNKETHSLTLGEYDFNRSFIYAQADAPTDPSATLQVLLVSPDFENAVSRPLAEWKQATEPDSYTSASPDASGSDAASPTPESSDSASLTPESSTSASPTPESSTSASPTPETPTDASPTPERRTSESPTPESSTSTSPDSQSPTPQRSNSEE